MMALPNQGDGDCGSCYMDHKPRPLGPVYGKDSERKLKQIEII